ncbi:MAG TPA: serine/threonine phosphatase [Trichocoleus sp.]
MLICPRCAFENPDQNRFCQQCGYALQVWRAWIMPRGDAADTAAESDVFPASPPEQPTALASEQPSTQPPTSKHAAQALLSLADLLPTYPYLDAQQRYQLQPDPRGRASGGQALSSVISATVIDCQPADESPLGNLQSQDSSLPELSSGLPSTAVLPPEAAPYLALQARFFPTIPALHDAWQATAYTVLLVEDRASWSLLGDMWKLGAVDPLQQLHWFYKMAELWEALAEWHGQSSLLDPANLRVDEDQILCLTYLTRDAAGPAPQLAALGQLWEGLIEPAQDAVPTELKLLIDQLAVGKFESTTALLAQLVQLADAFQAEPERPSEAAAPSAYTDPAAAAEPVDGSLRHPPAAPTLESVPEAELELPTLDELEDALGDEDTASIEELEEGEESLDLPTMVLPMKIVQLDEAGRTHVGRQRDHNEDFFCAQTELTKLEGPQGSSLGVKGLYILCDGMGGHASGEVASSLAVKTLQDYFVENPVEALPEEAVLVEAVVSANQAIYEINQGDARSGHGRMGTTLVMLMLANDRAVAAHVGDSRLYCYTRRSGLKQVTVDHEVGQREIQRGVEPAIAYARPDAYQLTQALGPRSRSELRPGINFLDITEDSLFILCSDGLSDNDLLEQHCSTHIEPLLKSQADLEEGVNRLIELANEHNGHDNITAILVRIKLRPSMDKLPAA